MSHVDLAVAQAEIERPTTHRRCRHKATTPGLAAKATIVLALCLTVQFLLAQAPPPPDAVLREEIDAQGYKYQVPNETLSKGPKAKAREGEERRGVRAVLAGQTSLAADPATRARFRAYFQQYFFPMMTTEEGQKTIAADRTLFLRDLQASKSPEAHAEVLSLTVQALQRIIQDSAYRLSARYNAMLIISNLNDQEPNALVVPQTLPEPMRPALPFILQQFQKPDNHDSLKIAALIGLARHLEAENYKQPPSVLMPAAAKAEIVKELTALAETKQPPPGRDADVHSWMRRRAIEGLALSCITRPDAGVAATMDKLLKDEADTLAVRTAAATALGRMSLQAPAAIDSVPTAKELGYLALVACDAELTRAESSRKSDAEREARLMGTYSGEIDYSGAGGGMPGMPGMSGMPGGGRLGGGDGMMPGGGVRPLRPTPGMSGVGGSADGGYGGIGSEYGGINTGLDPSMMDPKHYRVEYLRRRLRQHLYAVQLGLTGGEDHPPPRTTAQPAGSPTPTPIPKAAAADAVPPAEKKGVFSVAKTEAEKKEVDKVYHQVRRLAEIIEAAGPQAEFFQLIKDLRKELKGLEGITRRLPPPGAATAPGTALADDEPTVGAGKKAAGGKAKPAPVKAAPAPPKGKAAWRPTPRPQPVFAQPRFSR